MTQNTAVLVIDVQRDVVAGAHDADGVVARIADVVDRARASEVPVIWVQHDDEELVRDSEGWQLVPELVPLPGEPHIYKNYGDSFSNTELESMLHERGITELVICGAQSDFCIRNAWHSALVRGFDTVLVSDGHTTVDVVHDGNELPAAQLIAFTNMYADWGSSYPGRSGRVVSAAELSFD